MSCCQKQIIIIKGTSSPVQGFAFVLISSWIIIILNVVVAFSWGADYFITDDGVSFLSQFNSTLFISSFSKSIQRKVFLI